jgi:anti-anti-sigma factor
VIDLSDLNFIDSSGLHTLVRACENNGTRVVCPLGNIRRLFDTVSLGKLCPLHESLEEALAVSPRG